MTPIEEAFATIGKQIGSQSISTAILVATLHSEAVINGRSVARSLRTFASDEEAVTEQLSATADLIDRTIDKWEEEGFASLRPIK